MHISQVQGLIDRARAATEDAHANYSAADEARARSNGWANEAVSMARAACAQAREEYISVQNHAQIAQNGSLNTEAMHLRLAIRATERAERALAQSESTRLWAESLASLYAAQIEASDKCSEARELQAAGEVGHEQLAWEMTHHGLEHLAALAHNADDLNLAIECCQRACDLLGDMFAANLGYRWVAPDF